MDSLILNDLSESLQKNHLVDYSFQFAFDYPTFKKNIPSRSYITLKLFKNTSILPAT